MDVRQMVLQLGEFEEPAPPDAGADAASADAAWRRMQTRHAQTMQRLRNEAARNRN